MVCIHITLISKAYWITINHIVNYDSFMFYVMLCINLYIGKNTLEEKYVTYTYIIIIDNN